MAVTFLKKAKELVPANSIRYLLHKHLSGYDPARPLSRIHASELTRAEGFCPRFYALHDVTKSKPKDRYLTTSEHMTFQIGRDEERNVVNWFAEMGKAICHWKCVACGSQHEFCFRPKACGTCGCRVLEPKEVRFESAANGASCGVDMLLAMGHPLLRPVELKTMDKDEFKALKAPLAEHRWRTNLYLRLIDESDHPWSKQVATDRATIVYISKGGYGVLDPELAKWGLFEKFSPFKEYEIVRDDSQTDDLVARAQAVTDFRKKKAGMPCGICPTALSKRAAGCPMKKHCFSGAYPPEHDWAAK